MQGVKDASSKLINDKRLQTLNDTMKRHQYHRDSLLEILHTAQDLYGYIDKDLLSYVSKSLNVSPSHVYGVVTFYNLFKLKQPGAHVITFCLGTACYVRGIEKIINAVENEFKIKRGETSTDMKLSLFVTRCIGACAMAPNIIVDDHVIGRATTDVVISTIKNVLKGESIET